MSLVAERQPAPGPQPASPRPRAHILQTLGLGLITGASDDDRSGIGNYAVAGAALGFATRWTALV